MELKNKTLIGIDFSINKPGICCWYNGIYKFFGFPYGLSDKVINIYEKSPVTIISRTDDKNKGDDISAKMRFEINSAIYLADLIYETLLPYLGGDSYIAYEGLSYGSSGDRALELSGYKYILMKKLSESVPLKHMYTYSPLTVKATAKCSKRGMKKFDVIESFLKISNDNDLKTFINNNREMFMKKGNKNWIDHLDDIVDSYFVLETLRVKESNINEN